MVTGQPALNPLRGRRVLLTSESHVLAELSRRLAEAGAEVSTLATIRIVEPEDWEEVDRHVENLERYHWVAFTSRNAVGFLMDRMRAIRGTASWPAGPLVAAVGAGTLDALTSAGIEVALVPEEPGARGLLVALRKRGIAGTRVLLPGGDLAMPLLADGLSVSGAEVDRVTVYRTVEPDELDAEETRIVAQLQLGEISAVVFASPSAYYNLAARLAEPNTVLRLCHLICIGPTTAAAIGASGLDPAAVAVEPSSDGLFKTLLDLFSKEHPNALI